MKWSEAKNFGLVYTGQGPIGNGIVVEGKASLTDQDSKLGVGLKMLTKSIKTQNVSIEKLREFLSLTMQVELSEPLTDAQLQADWQKYLEQIQAASKK